VQKVFKINQYQSKSMIAVEWNCTTESSQREAYAKYVFSRVSFLGKSDNTKKLFLLSSLPT